MKCSVGRIMTTVGSLPRPSDLVELYRDDAPDNKLLPRLKSAVAEVVRRQAECGIDVVNDGEFGKAMRRAVDFGAWWSYVYDRLAGFELRQEQAKKGRAPRSIRESLESQPLSGLIKAVTADRSASHAIVRAIS
jgi:methionine synthase II (cobalamin-independent)